MKAQAVLAELEKAAEAMSIRVSYEALRASVGVGGMCRVKGEYRVIIDKRAGTNERIATIASALGSLDVSALELSPKVRDVVGYYAMRRAS